MAAADQFERLLAAGLAPHITNEVFEQIGAYLRTISQPGVANACLQRYLAVYRKYENDGNRTRGDAAFYLVLKRVLDLSKPAQLDTWYDALTSARQPRSPLGQRFDALGKADRDQLLQLAKAPRQARKETASVLGELVDAFRSARKRLPANGSELFGFDPVERDGPFRKEYQLRLADLQRGYDMARHGRNPVPGTDLAVQCAVFWSFVRAQRRDGLRLFQLLAYWRRDRIGEKGSQIPSNEVEQIAYVLITAGLLSYALATKAYPANVRLQSFTSEEWDFVLVPLRGRRYGDTYDILLHAFPAHASTFDKQCELFLRLIAFADQKDISLATNAELRRVGEASAATARVVIEKLQAGAIESYRAPGFVVTRAEAGRDIAAGTYRVGTEIAEMFRIVHFEGSPPQIYLEFNDIPCALFKASLGVFIRFAGDAPFELVRKYTAPLVYLIPLLFQVLLAVPGIVDGGFIGLVRALLSPLEMEAASAALDEFGLDPDQAGWWLLAASLLTRRVRSSADGLRARGLQDPALEQRGTQSVKGELTASRGAAITDEGLGAARREETAASEAADDEKVPAAGGRGKPAVPDYRLPANQNSLIRATAAPANENRLAHASEAELAEFAYDAEGAQQVAAEIAEVERQLAQEESEELAERAAAGGRQQGTTGASRGTVKPARSTGNTSSGVLSQGTGGPRAGSAPKAPPPSPGRVVLDTAVAKIRNLPAKTRRWLEDAATEWRNQCARVKRMYPLKSARDQGILAHQATQRAMRRMHPDTAVEEITGVSSSRVSRRSDISQAANVGVEAVGEFKPWAYRTSDGSLITSRAAAESGVETLQIQAYGIVDRELKRPTFVFTARGEVYTPGPGGRWIPVAGR